MEEVTIAVVSIKIKNKWIYFSHTPTYFNFMLIQLSTWNWVSDKLDRQTDR